jgi:hypothetical protein
LLVFKEDLGWGDRVGSALTKGTRDGSEEARKYPVLTQQLQITICWLGQSLAVFCGVNALKQLPGSIDIPFVKGIEHRISMSPLHL